MAICQSCGTENHETLENCRYCGADLKKKHASFETFHHRPTSRQMSDKNYFVLLLLFIFLPTAHYVYVNKIGLAFLFFITGGGFGIWWLIDLLRIIFGYFTDDHLQPIRL